MVASLSRFLFAARHYPSPYDLIPGDCDTIREATLLFLNDRFVKITPSDATRLLIGPTASFAEAAQRVFHVLRYRGSAGSRHQKQPRLNYRIVS